VPSALLFILLGVMWAVVLVPMWLRKHDAADESRSVDRFHRALDSLSGRRNGEDAQDTVIVRDGKVPKGRDVLMPGRPRGAQQAQVMVSGTATVERAVRADGPAARRRRLLLGLLLVTALVVVAGLLHRVPLWTAAIPALLALVLLVSGRRQAARRAEMARRRRRRHVLSAAARVAADRRGQSPVRAGRVEEVALPDLDADGVVPEAEYEPVDSWEAVPTTLPTYVTAPAATKVPRVIDRTTPGAWSGAAMLEQAERTRQVEQDADSGMRVESFEISVSRPPSAAEAFAAEYVDTSAGAAELDATDDEAALAALLDDPRTGVVPRDYRQAAG
jgi:hypothetical protein